MTLTLEHKTVFGNELYYPICKDSKIIVRLMGRQAFTEQQVKELKADGWTIDLKQKAL